MSRRALRHLAIAVASAALLAGCASFRPLPAGSTFELAPDEGLLVIHTVTDRPVLYVTVNGEAVVRSLKRGVRYEIVVAKAGTYRWTEVALAERDEDSRLWKSSWRMKDIRDYWTFRVEPGVINYPGQLAIYTAGGLRKGLSDLRIANRSAQIWVLLREQRPDLVERYRLVYTGGERDAFFERVVGGAPARGAR